MDAFIKLLPDTVKGIMEKVPCSRSWARMMIRTAKRQGRCYVSGHKHSDRSHNYMPIYSLGCEEDVDFPRMERKDFVAEDSVEHAVKTQPNSVFSLAGKL